MATKHKPKPLHSTTVTDLGPNEIGEAGQHSAVLQQILISFQDNDVTSPIVETNIDTNTKTMNLSVGNCNIAVFGQSSTVHHSDCHLPSTDRGKGDLGQAVSYVQQIQWKQ